MTNLSISNQSSSPIHPCQSFSKIKCSTPSKTTALKVGIIAISILAGIPLIFTGIILFRALSIRFGKDELPVSIPPSDQIPELNQKLETSIQQLTTQTKSNKLLKENISNLKQQLQRENDQLETQQGELTDSKNQIRQLEQQLQESNRSLGKRDSNLEQQLDEAKRQLETQKKEFTHSENQIRELEQQLQKARNQHHQLKQLLINQSGTNTLLLSRNKNLQQEIQHNERQLNKLREELSNKENQSLQINQQSQKIRSDSEIALSRIHNQLAEKQKEIDRYKEKIASANRVRDDNLTQHEETEKQLRSQLAKRDHSLQNLEAQNLRLEELTRGPFYYPQMTQELIEFDLENANEPFKLDLENGHLIFKQEGDETQVSESAIEAILTIIDLHFSHLNQKTESLKSSAVNLNRSEIDKRLIEIKNIFNETCKVFNQAHHLLHQDVRFNDKHEQNQKTLENHITELETLIKHCSEIVSNRGERCLSRNFFFQDPNKESSLEEITSCFEAFCEHTCPGAPRDEIEQMLNDGKQLTTKILNGSAEAVSPTLREVASIIWFLTEKAIDQNQGFEEGTFVIEDDNDHLYHFLMSYEDHYERLSSHYKNRTNGTHYGLDLFPERENNQIFLPALKRTLLFGKADNRDGKNPKHVLFIKPENYSAKSDELQDLACHAYEFFVAQVRKSTNPGADDAMIWHKERVPNNVLNAFSQILDNQDFSFERKKTLMSDAKKWGISYMYDYVQDLTKDLHDCNESKHSESDQLKEACDQFDETLKFDFRESGIMNNRQLPHLDKRTGREVYFTKDDLIK